ncbi:MAG: sigma-70 family RNA polymerase sigma factor [Verrucomicrobiota bacterium]
MSAPSFEQSLRRSLSSLQKRARALAKGDAAYADDLLQDALLKAWCARGGLKDTARFEPWVKSIMLNVLRNSLRKPALDLVDADPWDTATPATQAADLEMKELVGQLATLPSKQGEAMDLVALRGFTYEEAARRAHSTPSAMKSRVARGRHAIALLRQ